MRPDWRALATVAGLMSLAVTHPAFSQQNPAADFWLTNDHRFPAPIETNSVSSNVFASLRAEVVADRLRVVWTPPPNIPAGQPMLHSSPANLNHWPIRDWRGFEMLQHGTNWEANLPVEDPDVPMAYFVALSSAGGAVSPMRGLLPRQAGLEEPTRIFWPFLEGFEDGARSWRLVTPPANASALRLSNEPRTGRHALALQIPSGKASATVATTRVRGWQLVRQPASGLRLWMKTRTGPARARCTLLSHAETPAQTVAAWPKDIAITDKWSKVDLPFAQLGVPVLSGVDLFAIEFIGNSGQELLLDDLQLLGQWKLEGE